MIFGRVRFDNESQSGMVLLQVSIISIYYDEIGESHLRSKPIAADVGASLGF